MFLDIMLMSKIIFKNKKYYFNIFLNKKYFKKSTPNIFTHSRIVLL